MKINGYQIMNSSFSQIKLFQNGKESQLQSKKNVDDSFTNRDSVVIFSLGKCRNNQIKNLMGQKQLLLERKEGLINSTLEKGYDVTSIQDILDSYEEQLREVDQQISQEMAKQNEKQLESMQSSKKNYKQKTKQEMEQEKISNLIELSSGMSQTKALQSSQTQVEGEARVLESETKMDKGKSTDTEILAKNEERLSQLQQKSAELTSKMVKLSGEMLDKIDEHNKNTAQELLKEETTIDNNTIDENIKYKESKKRDFDENTIEVEK